MDAGLPKVSYLIPSYNHRQTIQQTIDSILAQDYPNIELVVCDDVSRDGSHEFLEAYAREKGFRYVRNDANMGAGETSDKLLELATGEFVSFLPSDDWIEPAKTSKQMAYMLEGGYDAVLGPVRHYHEDTGSFHQQDYSYLVPIVQEGRYLELICTHDRVGALIQSGILRRSCLLDLKIHVDGYKSEDWLLMIRFLTKGYKLGFLDETLTNYRIHASNYHKQALYCLNELQLPVIRDWVPAPYKRRMTAAVYTTAALKLVEDAPLTALGLMVRSTLAKPGPANLVTFAKAYLMSVGWFQRLYLGYLRPLYKGGSTP